MAHRLIWSRLGNATLLVAMVVPLAGMGIAGGTAPTVPRCQVAQLVVRVGVQGAAQQHHHYPVIFTNKGDDACRLSGTPGLQTAQSYHRPDNGAYVVAIKRVGPDAAPRHRAHVGGTVVLASHGGVASSWFGFSNAAAFPQAKCASGHFNMLELHLLGVPELFVSFHTYDDFSNLVCTKFRTTTVWGVERGTKNPF